MGFGRTSRGAWLGGLLLFLGGCAGVETRPEQQSHAYVNRCQDAVRRDMANVGLPGDVHFPTGVALAATPRAMNVQGLADVQPDRGQPQRYEYSCSFDPQDGDRLSRSGFNRPAEQAGPGAAPATLVDRCQADVERTVNAQLAPANVRFVASPATVVSPEVTQVQGDAEVTPNAGPARRFTYYCSFREDDGQR